jgi:hypothetical protein
VPGELVELGERARVEQRLDPLARGHLPRRVLLLDRALGAGVRGFLDAPLEVGQLPGGRVDVDVVGDVLPGTLEFGGAHSDSSLALVGRVRRGARCPSRDLTGEITGRSVRERLHGP